MRNRATIPAMNLAVPKPMSLTQFLAWEERQELRYEFDGTRPIAMVGRDHPPMPPSKEISPSPSSDASAASHANSSAATSSFRSPKAISATPTEWSSAPPSIRPLLSSTTPSSSSKCSAQAPRRDRIVKAREYQATPSVQRYVMLEQDGVGATVYARTQDAWSVLVLKPDDPLDMPEIGLSIPLAEFYEGLSFETDPAEDYDSEPAPPSGA